MSGHILIPLLYKLKKKKCFILKIIRVWSCNLADLLKQKTISLNSPGFNGLGRTCGVWSFREIHIKVTSRGKNNKFSLPEAYKVNSLR